MTVIRHIKLVLLALLRVKIISWRVLIFGSITGFGIPLHASTTETVIRAVCDSGSGLVTKYYQQGIEVWGSDFFYDGMPMEEWLNAQDMRSGGAGEYTCYTQEALRPYPESVIDALKAAKNDNTSNQLK